MLNIFGSQSSRPDWRKLLQALKPVIGGVSADEWGGPEDVEGALDRVLRTLEKDVKAIGKCDFIFSTHQKAGGQTEELAAYLRSWYVMGQAPSLVSLVVAACEEFDIASPDYVQILLMAAVLGDVENDLPYHNNAHFKKVLLQLIRLISVHNSIYGGTVRALSKEQIALLLIGGCIHDLGHDGLGNTVKGVFYSGRLERQSFDFAVPYLRAAGAGEIVLEALKTIILTTDVTPLGNVTNPMHQMKAAYRFHFLGENKQYSTLNLSDDWAMLEDDAMLTLMACLLQEADIATSAGVDYAVTQYETCILMEEIGGGSARPSHVLDFLDKVCQRRFLSDAGQKLFAANMARIYALAEEAERAGDEAFPTPQHTDFILGAGSEEGRSKTIN
ncbi:MAG: hypothetical protein R3E13_03715 [Alphaproteobacteria bacterium]